MDTQTQIDRLIELAIVQRTELKQLVEQLPSLREHLNAEVERTIEEVEPQLRAELEEFCDKRAVDANAKVGSALEAKIVELSKNLELTTQARYSAIKEQERKVEELRQLAEKKIEGHVAALPEAVKEIVGAELARFPRAGEIDQLRKEFAEPRGLNPRGKWLPTETYNKLDLVTWNGDSYVSNIDGNKERPARNSSTWTLSAARGIGGGGPSDLSALTAVPSNGSLLIGSGTSWVNGNLVAGDGITITNGAGSISIAANGGVNYQGTWNASTNTPTLTSSVGTKGFYYVVSVAGTTNLNGVTDWQVGDWAIFNGTAWEKVDTTDQVSSVFGRTGAVVGVSTDYSSVGITNTAIGASNPSTGAFTTLSASGAFTANATTDSSSKDTGAIVTEGGLGVEKSATIGGNVGVGIAPSSIWSSAKAAQINSGLTLMGDQANGYISGNSYYNGTNWIYNTTNKAVRLDLENGVATFLVAGTGTAGNPITYTSALSINNAGSTTLAGNLTVSGTGTSSVAGNLGINNTSPAYRLEISGAATNYSTAPAVVLSDTTGVAASRRWLIGNVATNYGDLNFAVSTTNSDAPTNPKMTLNSSGNLGIGTTSPAAKLQVSGGRTYLGSSDGYELAFTRTANYFYWYNDGGNITGKLSLTDTYGAGGEIITFVQNSRNVLIGTTTDSANGKLQLATHTTSAGGIGFGTDISFYRKSAALMGLNGSGGAKIDFHEGGTLKGGVGTYAGSMYVVSDTTSPILFYTNASLALTLDSSQNATFAGKITANGAGSTFKGTATNDNAAAGYVGEYVTSTVASGSAVTLTNATAADITSISLTAGDWDISGNVAFKPNGSPTVSYYVGGAIATSATIATDENRVQWADPSTSKTVVGAIPTRRVTIASTTTIYLTGYSEYTGGTNVTAYGRISARRVR